LEGCESIFVVRMLQVLVNKGVMIEPPAFFEKIKYPKCLHTKHLGQSLKISEVRT
jgi:hypothetical protein